MVSDRLFMDVLFCYMSFIQYNYIIGIFTQFLNQDTCYLCLPLPCYRIRFRPNPTNYFPLVIRKALSQYCGTS